MFLLIPAYSVRVEPIQQALAKITLNGGPLSEGDISVRWCLLPLATEFLKNKHITWGILDIGNKTLETNKNS